MQVAPNEAKGLHRVSGQAPQDQQRNGSGLDCLAAEAGAQDGDAVAIDKAFRTLQAEFALLGHALVDLHGSGPDAYLVTRWNCCRGLPSLQAAGAFLRQIGGARG